MMISMKKFLFVLFVWGLLLSPVFVFVQAATSTSATSTLSVISLPNPLSSETLEQLIDVVINWLLVITLPIVIFLIVYAGAQILISGIAPKQREEAKNVIKYALIGYVIILLAKILVGVVKGLFS